MAIQLITGIGRRRLLQGGATLAALQIASPAIIKARGETPIKLGLIDPLTGGLSALAVSEVEGAKFAVEKINKKGGVLGRQLELLVEDSANDVGTGVQKARKLIERDQVDAIFGDVNSGIAYAIEGSPARRRFFISCRAATPTRSPARIASGTSSASATPPRWTPRRSPRRWSRSSARNSTSSRPTTPMATRCRTISSSG